MSHIQTFTFWQLANQYKIEIPIVQRDYAQGRQEVKATEIRNKLIIDLQECLTKNKTIELDFIYGKVEDDIFIPIDGQQRLTTLFLLHWYIATRSGNLDNFKKISFSYKTRMSSKDFCKSLSTSFIDFDKLLEPDKDERNRLSKTIINSSWFFLSWKNDPTVQSMLHMLDSIHLNFERSDFPRFYEILTTPNFVLPKDNPKLNALISAIEANERTNQMVLRYLEDVRKEPIISFKFLNLEDFQLTDDLYLKMNARGRGLSDFEKFKAWLIGYIDDLMSFSGLFPHRLRRTKYNLRRHLSSRKGEAHLIKTDEINLFKEKWCQEFILDKNWYHLMDKNWTDFLWNNRNIGENESNENTKADILFDNIGIHFVKNIAFINYFIGRNNKDETNLNKDCSNYLNNSETTVFLENIYKLCFKDIKSCQLLLDTFNVLSQNFSDLANQIPVLWEDDNDNFRKCLLASSSFRDKGYLYAIVQFYSTNLARNGFDDWFRVIRNLIENTIIVAENFTNVLKSISALSKQIVLKDELYKTIGFNSDQIKEEFVKIELFEKHADWKSQIIEAENHPFFKGNIGFLLPEGENSDLDVFINRKEVATLLFDKNGVTVEKETNLLGRALLISGLELPNDLWLGGRVQDWKSLLKHPLVIPSIRNAIDVLIGNDKNNYVTLLNDSLTKILNNNELPKWKKTIIENPELLKEYSHYGRIINNNRGINLYQQEKFNSKVNAILIENNRNEVITHLIKECNFLLYDPDDCIIKCERFYAGDKIQIHKEILNESLQMQELNLLFGKERVKASISNEETIIIEFDFTDENRPLLDQLKIKFPMFFSIVQ